MEHMGFSRWRKALWSEVRGHDILEVGVGTGKNIPFYPKDKNITAIDISPKMLDKAIKKAKSLGVTARFLEMDVQKLEFEDNSFDTIVNTCVFCSVPAPILGFKEMKRVIRPDGRLLMMEHMRPGKPIMGFFFDLLNPVVVRITGANINRETMQNIESGRWTVKNEQNIFMDFVKLIEAVPNNSI
jgi:ubiquinone/menaquinone biosynthesis C-methylase UbiE